MILLLCGIAILVALAVRAWLRRNPDIGLEQFKDEATKK